MKERDSEHKASPLGRGSEHWPRTVLDAPPVAQEERPGLESSKHSFVLPSPVINTSPGHASETVHHSPPPALASVIGGQSSSMRFLRFPNIGTIRGLHTEVVADKGSIPEGARRKLTLSCHRPPETHTHYMKYDLKIKVLFKSVSSVGGAHL